jgi:RND superfamily putative drug exporter
MATPPRAGRSFTSRIGLWSAHHKRLVLPVWLLFIFAAVGVCSSAQLDTDLDEVESLPGEVGRAQAIVADRFPVDDLGSEATLQEILVFSHPSLAVDDPVYQQTVEGLVAELATLRVAESDVVGGITVGSNTRIVTEVTSHYDLGAPREESPFVAVRDGAGDVTFALVQINADAVETVEKFANIEVVLDAVTAAVETSEGFEILIGGDASLQHQMTTIVDEDFARASVINLPITFIILFLAFGALLAAAVPLTLGFTAIAVAVAVITLISQVTPLHSAAEQMVLLLGLATGIDYSLFVITRYRNEMSGGRSPDHALQVAMGTSGKAIVFAGASTVFALGGMWMVGNPIFSSLGLASQVVVIVAMLSGLTLLPALIGLFGSWINRLGVPYVGRLRRETSQGLWGYLVDRVLRRPALSAGTAVVVLLALAAPILTINLGFNGPRSLPKDAEGTKALIALEENFTLGLAQPAIVVVDAGAKQNVFAADIQRSIASLVGLVEADTLSPENPDALFGPLTRPPKYSDAGDAALLYVPVNGDSAEERALDAVAALRENLIPEAFAGSTADAPVTGATAANIDFRNDMVAKTPLVIGFVLTLSFVIVLLAFRSLVIAVTAIALNSISVAVAYGLLVLVFQEGFLFEGVFGFEATGVIESWLPLFLFSLLFGLSIDYEMFVMGRIKELYERGYSTDDAIAEGVKGTAAVITNAAAIMVAVALIFAFMRDLGMKQFGFGLAMAILFDATIIRAFILPTTMKLLGEKNWYLPSWLEWIPSLPMSEEIEPGGHAPMTPAPSGGGAGDGAA